MEENQKNSKLQNASNHKRKKKVKDLQKNQKTVNKVLVGNIYLAIICLEYTWIKFSNKNTKEWTESCFVFCFETASHYVFLDLATSIELILRVGMHHHAQAKRCMHIRDSLCSERYIDRKCGETCHTNENQRDQGHFI